MNGLFPLVLLVSLGARGDGGTFADLTGPLVNQSGGDLSEFDIRLSGDGPARAYDIGFLDLSAGVPMASIPVELIQGAVDTDNDGISDISDNCIEAVNADQRDTDSDGIGNVCDPDVAVPNDCAVNFLDLDVYRDNFFQPGDLDTDNNGDGQTNFADLNIVRSLFFDPPGPSGLPNACTQLSEGKVCDPGASLCGAGLTCCYPCGIPGCDFVCEVTCDPSDPGCFDGCFLRP